MTMRKTLLPLSVLLIAACANVSSTDPQSSTTEEPLLGDGIFCLHGVPSAQPKSIGVPAPDLLPPELIQTVVAEGSNKLENPATVSVNAGVTTTVSYYGFAGDEPPVPVPGDVQTATHKVEATKTEPDKNTYLTLTGQTGPDAGYDYGTHFVYQGHENSTSGALGAAGYITRINLDADGPHKVTLMASADKTGKLLPPIDGSTWNPFAQRLMFTAEGGAGGGAYMATLGFPSSVENLFGSMGQGGFEGIQNDSAGNIWIVEDSGGPTSAGAPHAKVPNSFIYRFVPKRIDDPRFGKLQALQVISKQTGLPISFHGADTDTLSTDVQDLHTYGNVFTTHWVTIHDTGIDGTASFSANALAKAKLATPFKRPENGQFRPGSGFKEFFFDETGDTDVRTEAGSAFGGFGGVMKLSQVSPTADDGQLSLFFLGDEAHAGFDNCAFWSSNTIVFVEDRGDTLHAQLNALDSAWLFDVTVDYSNPANQPTRLLAQGRDFAATLDSQLGGQPGFQNDGDNEITGFHISNGDPSTKGILGAQAPHPFSSGWRVFYTAQHGLNRTLEVLPNKSVPAPFFR